ncbi:hypothetical protein F0919_17895 [Taibaiella lutea]|uniref:Uncharacterized protein n=1 Tax=Taibaiella lutea TaxID=2608001 RepID=A0A5M6CBX7_9BACT|nr:hypothetical protein [Taibaiella lutea]KAA5532654.1 hypothetical protein F0919_17895 [Taibaiella lutea]
MRRKVTVTTITFPDLKEQLRELALLDMDKFLKLTGVDMVQVVVCSERAKKKSLQQIANKVKLSKSTVQSRCRKCGEQLKK